VCVCVCVCVCMCVCVRVCERETPNDTHLSGICAFACLREVCVCVCVCICVCVLLLRVFAPAHTLLGSDEFGVHVCVQECMYVHIHVQI